MPKRSNKNTDKKKGLEPTIVVALIGLAGTIIGCPACQSFAGTLASCAADSGRRNRTAANTTTGTQALQATPQIHDSSTAAGAQLISNPISLNQTVTGMLYGAEAGIWTFSEGPAAVTIILDVGPFGGALIIVKDPSGVDRAYMDQQTRPGVTQLVNFLIPTEGDYTIWVRNTVNEQTDYTLTVQDVLTPPPP